MSKAVRDGFMAILGQDEVWYHSRGSFMPDSVSLVRLELGKIQSASKPKHFIKSTGEIFLWV